jgi:4-alpha-glucanotransferase
MNIDKINPLLNRLARLYNVQTAYYGVNHRRKQVSAESITGILRALGGPVETEKDIVSAIRERTLSNFKQLAEPVAVAWNGEPPKIKLVCPSGLAEKPVTYRLEVENGEKSALKINTDKMKILKTEEVEGVRYVSKEITLPQSLPYGYHKLVLEVGNKSCETLILSAPQKTYLPSSEAEKRRWGAFMPLYALQGRDSWGSGDYNDLGSLADWVVEKGGSVMATLPLLPLFLDEPYEPSPYAPVSRLLWNEFYIDVSSVSEFQQCPSVQEQAKSVAFRQDIIMLQQNPMVDYRKIMSLKRQVMEEMSRYLLSSENARSNEFRHFVRENPPIEQYADFRAVMEKRHATWGQWPQLLRDGTITPNDYDKSVKDYHLYAQWLANQQVKALSENARAKDMKMYFDLPLGVHADGFDAWQRRDIFAVASAGAPPDAVFTGGQNWGFPPLHPEKIREDGYRYVRDYLHHNLQYADILRIDHVMGLHRLFWIPPGEDANRGTYVRYHADELYAILSLESHRHQSVIVGEDLGIVPGYIKKAISSHDLNRMYVLYYELADDPTKALRSIASHTVASLNTHDMAPFAAFWEENDITERLKLGLVDAKGAVKEKKSRQTVKKALTIYLREKKYLSKAPSGTRAALNACLAYLSASQANTVLVNLEDLWLETRSQNVPGVGEKFPSWQRKARYSLEEFSHDKEVGKTLEEVDRHRKQKSGKER